MKILLAVFGMAFRSGAEMFVHDVALALQRRGHSVLVFAPILGDLTDGLRRRGIACVSDLTQVAEPPDLIIGNTRDETATCLAQFLDTPAISICHDRTDAKAQPPMFTRVRQHVAVDANCAERLSLEHGIAPTDIAIVSNGVDLQRFRPRPPLPAKPTRAAIFSNYATESDDTRAIRAACESLGVSLEVIGEGVGRQATAPEQELPRFDLVFAKARCAMEAMAVGCAVVLLNEGMGMAGMVNSANVRDWHHWNFGRRLMQHPIRRDAVHAAMLGYDAEDAARVTEYVRTHVSLEATADALESLAQKVLAAESGRPAADPRQELREFALHTTRNFLPHGTPYQALQTGELLGKIQDLENRLGEASQGISHLQAQLHAAHLQNIALDQQVHVLQACRQHEGDLVGQLQAMRASRSWQLTAPLRWFGGLWKSSRRTTG